MRYNKNRNEKAFAFEEVPMKKRILLFLLPALLLFSAAGTVSAAGYDYTLTNLKATSDTVSVDVTRVSDREGTDVVFVAVYDEYNTLIGLKKETIAIGEKDTVYTVEVPMYVNSAVTLKAFVWDGDMPLPRSKTVYKSTRPGGDIEDGGIV